MSFDELVEQVNKEVDGVVVEASDAAALKDTLYSLMRSFADDNDAYEETDWECKGCFN